jgi:hypothetical protein
LLVKDPLSSANSTIGTSATSTEDGQPQHNQQAEHPNMAVQQEVRRSKRTIQKPSKRIHTDLASERTLVLSD